MSGFGAEKPDLLIVGEAPRGKDDKDGKPFAGEPGLLLRGQLSEVGIKSVYYTNLIKCAPPFGVKIPAAAVKACRKYLDAEIAELKPKWVATLGSLPSKAVLKKAKITEAHGQVVPFGTIQGVPLFDPGYAIRDPSKMPTFKADVRRLSRAMRGELIKTTIEWEVIDAEKSRSIYQ